MIQALLVVGIVLAWLIARFNKSNKLFWVLFTSFVVGIAGGFLLHKKVNTSKEEIVSSSPTHECIYTQKFWAPVTCVKKHTPTNKTQNRVSKDGDTITSSDRCSGYQDDEINILPPRKPPKTFKFFDTS